MRSDLDVVYTMLHCATNFYKGVDNFQQSGGGGGGVGLDLPKTFHQVIYSWGSGGAVSLPAGPGLSPVRGPLSEAPETLKSLHSSLPENPLS